MTYGFILRSGQADGPKTQIITPSSHLSVQHTPAISRLRFAIFRGNGVLLVRWLAPAIARAYQRIAEIC